MDENDETTGAGARRRGSGAAGRSSGGESGRAMIEIEKIGEMRSWSERERGAGRRVALAPTMGFLHEGHLSLVRDGRGRADRLVVSLFVNPAQFGPREDFAAYPRDLERDRNLLAGAGVDVLFRPPVEEMYPGGFQTRVEVDRLSALLCGKARPGHFAGVATVVAKLFNIVRPHVAIFGAKDHQQLQIVRRLAADLDFDVEIASHPIVREPDGLAMSSRNAYLAPEERRAALCLSRALREAEAMVGSGERRRGPIVDRARAAVEGEPLARLEYVSLCDPASLEEVGAVDGAAVLALAARFGRARLIDNTMLEP